MAQIPWWVWLGVGIFVAITSSFASIPLFIWVGVAFIVVGIAKLVYLFVFKEPEVKQVVNQSVKSQRSVFCSHCRLASLETDNFCRHCGSRLKPPVHRPVFPQNF